MKRSDPLRRAGEAIGAPARRGLWSLLFGPKGMVCPTCGKALKNSGVVQVNGTLLHARCARRQGIAV